MQPCQNFSGIALACSAAAGLLGCDAPDLAIGNVTEDVTSPNGTSLNGTSLNGTSLNGTSLNGTSLNGTSTTGTSALGLPLDAVAVTGQVIFGTALIGSTWQGSVSDGSTLALRVDSAVAGEANLWFYDVTYATQGGRASICGTDASGADILALPVPGVWSSAFGTPTGGAYTASPLAFTLACRGKTIAKCVELGYNPLTGYLSQLQACVRMLRGDYCGDGTPYTVTGQTINLYDNVGVQADTESWNVDAAWNASGATCIGLQAATRYYQTGVGTPWCVASGAKKNDAKCGAKFNAGAVLVDETP